ncbi:MAG: FCD domain-containing protein, partial [Microbacteriaceae bacterium]|nr:FCD domain-containing protein [Microbacteriaceae bacterium]
VHGMPVLRGALAHIVCTTAEEAVGGTHTVFLGNVIVAGTSNAQPLAYYRGAFGSFHSDREEQAYLTVRRWVLEHRELKNQIIPLAELVESVGLPKDQVGRAVAKLTVDRLLGIDLNDQITVLPITSKLMTDCIEGRAAIECGVLTTHLDTLSDQDAAEIRTIFEQMQQLRGTPGEMRTFLNLNNTLQNRIMNLGSSYELTRALNRMGIGAVWAQTVPHDSWDQFFDSRSQQKLVDALEQRDAAAACEAVMEHARVTTRLAQELIEKNGGEV